jgi:hypothetical protein
MFGTGAAFLTTSLVNVMPGVSPSMRLAYAATIVGVLVYAVGIAASFWMPEPPEQELPE